MKSSMICLSILLCIAPISAFPEVVINEIHYHPPEIGLEDSSLREFIELYNPGPGVVDLSGYNFLQGVFYTIPRGTTLKSGAYLIVAKDPTYKTWRNRNFPVLGPYTDTLADGGERVSLYRPDGTLADSVKYNDRSPWPLAPDGYGSSLERITWDLSADDFHSWRASLTNEGTPGKANSVVGMDPRPVILSVEMVPTHPTSKDSVTVRIGFDTPGRIDAASLLWETAGGKYKSSVMQKTAEIVDCATYEIVLPPVASQILIRFNAELLLSNSRQVRLPHEAEPQPFFSYFVYDGEITARLPILWILPPTPTSLLKNSRAISGAVILPMGQTAPTVFDGALLTSARNGNKLKFLKDAEFQGNRTLNLIPEIPAGGTNSGVNAAFTEHLGWWFFREMGVLALQADFYRVVTLPLSARVPQAQRLIIQQVNKEFLQMNGRDPNGDLYKLVYTVPNWEKHTNPETGTASVDALVAALSVNNSTKRREAIEKYLNVDEFIVYSTASVLTSNWDGFWNNNWMYLDPTPGGRWEIIPWDLDWMWGSTTGAMYAKMPVTFPIDGVAVGATQASRPPGRVLSPLHKDKQFYQDYLLRLRHEITRAFSEKRLFDKIDEMQNMLLDDLQLMERLTGVNRPERYTQIRQSYSGIKTFITQRRAYLDGVLPVPVADWEKYE